MTTACPRCSYDASATVTARWVFTLPLDVPSQNAAHNKTRFSKEARRYRMFREGMELLLTCEMRARGIPKASARRRVMFVRLIGKGKRAYDRGNLCGGFKSGLDAMVRVGLLVDDTEKWCDDGYAQERAADGKDGVRIEIEELA